MFGEPKQAFWIPALMYPGIALLPFLVGAPIAAFWMHEPSLLYIVPLAGLALNGAALAYGCCRMYFLSDDPSLDCRLILLLSFATWMVVAAFPASTWSVPFGVKAAGYIVLVFTAGGLMSFLPVFAYRAAHGAYLGFEEGMLDSVGNGPEMKQGETTRETLDNSHSYQGRFWDRPYWVPVGRGTRWVKVRPGIDDLIS